MQTARVLPILFLSILPSFANAGTLLPNGKQTFLSNNGQPLSIGYVYFYIPGTTTNKNTYKDSAQTILNTNPVRLDAAGRAIIYGSGTYRQVVKDMNGNIIWDQLTNDTSGSVTFFGGTSTGSGNAQVVAGSSFSAVPGQAIEFIAGFTNSGPVTISPDAGATNYPTVLDTPVGPLSLVGGEIVQGNSVTAIIDTAGIFHISPAVRTNSVGTLPSLPTTDLGSVGTNTVKITGTTPISSFGTTASVNSPFYDLYFVSGLTVSHSSNILMGNDLVTSSGDYARFAYNGNGVWQLVTYAPLAGNVVGANGNFTGSVSINGDLNVAGTSNLKLGFSTYTGNASSDPYYSTIGGSIIGAPNAAFRGSNTISARCSLNNGGFNNTFNVSNAVHGSTGVYAFTFIQPVFNTSYEVVTSPSINGSSLVVGIATAKSVSGFTVTYYNSSGAATDLGSAISDVIATGGN